MTRDPSSDRHYIFISGFNAARAVEDYIGHLLSSRPELDGRWTRFSWWDSPARIAAHVSRLDGPVTLIGNSLGGGRAAQVAVASKTDLLVTIDPFGRRDADLARVAAHAPRWLNIGAPKDWLGHLIEPLSAGRLTRWGDRVEPHASHTLHSARRHAEFWPLMDERCGFAMRDI